MIMTDKEKMVLTPTYYVFKMYVPFQDATFVPVAFNAGTYTHGDISLPRVDAIAAKDTAGKLWLEITNLDPDQPAEIEASLAGVTAKSAAGETLTAPKVDSVNTFDAPNSVVPKPVSAKVQGGKVALMLHDQLWLAVHYSSPGVFPEPMTELQMDIGYGEHRHASQRAVAEKLKPIAQAVGAGPFDRIYFLVDCQPDP